MRINLNRPPIDPGQATEDDLDARAAEWDRLYVADPLFRAMADDRIVERPQTTPTRIPRRRPEILAPIFAGVALIGAGFLLAAAANLILDHFRSIAP